MWSDWLFDTPWWLIALLAGVGAVIFVAGNRRQDKSIMRTGLVLFLLGAVAGTVSYFVDTDKEKAVARTRAIARAVGARDWDTLRSLLDPNTTLNTQPLRYSNREQIVTGGRDTAERIGLKSVRLTSVKPTQVQTVITVDVDALSEQDLFPSNTPTSWRFQYQNLGQGWELTSIQPLPNRFVNEETVGQQLARPR